MGRSNLMNYYTREQRRIDATPITWDIMNKYMKNNFIPPWIMKSAQYFNKKIRVQDEDRKEQEVCDELGPEWMS